MKVVVYLYWHALEKNQTGMKMGPNWSYCSDLWIQLTLDQIKEIEGMTVLFWAKLTHLSINGPHTHTRYQIQTLHLETLITIYTNYIFWWRDDVLLMKNSQAISRIAVPNMGLFVLILMHFQCWFQIWAQYQTIQNFFENFLKKKVTVSTVLNIYAKRVKANR